MKDFAAALLLSLLLFVACASDNISTEDHWQALAHILRLESKAHTG